MTFVDWRQSHLKHVLAAKEQDKETCDQCVRWAWLYLGECICGTVQITGCCLVVIAIIIFVPVSCRTRTNSQSPSTDLSLSLIALLISAIGLAGAFLSMQMVLVIAYDATAVIVDFVSVMCVIGGRAVRRYSVDRNRLPYQQLPGECDSESQNQPRLRSDSVWKFMCHGALSLTLMSLVCATQSVNPIGTRTRRDLQFQNNTTINLREVLVIVGYIMGSLACFGHWAFQYNIIRLKEEFQNGTPTQRDSKGMMLSRAFMIVSRSLYITGILLQSGGWMFVMVTTPWTAKSFIGAHAEAYEMYLSLRFYRQNKKANDTDDSDVISLTESGSDTSNILWDRAWKDRSGLDNFPYYEKVKPKCFDVQALRFMSNNISTNSEFSSSSDEQELEWEDANIAPYNPPSRDIKIRMERILNSTPPRAIPLTLTMPEPSDQRIITWISNSTPEEEKSPMLTMALNLDSSPQTPTDPSMIGDSRTFPHSSPRKNSM